jgi:predicted ATPase/DNA-binding winged helix-turn-helix (wHTH) protein
MLLDAGRPIHLSSRALDILVVLVEHAGELVEKEELIARAWPNTLVEENNLRVHIGTLRKILGEMPSGAGYVATVPGRGYTFVAPVERAAREASTTHVAASSGAEALPAPLVRMIGRAETLVRLLSSIRSHRLVTIVGPGGMGKTTVALEVARRLSRSLKDQARFVDLSTLADPKLLASAVASAFGIPTRPASPLMGLLAYLRDKRLLVVLDNCEHVIDAAATVAQEVLAGASGVRILATSREPLGVEGEWVERLAPLPFPERHSGVKATDALSFPAIQLFAERTASSIEGFELSDADVPSVVDICRKVEGIPLALELAAATVGLFGIAGLALRLNDQLDVLTRGRRTALARHKTLRATIDWSYGILTKDEQKVLNRLSLFSGEFTLECALEVAAAPARAPELLAGLVSKSLVVASLKESVLRYRLLDSTRAYAREKLLASEEYREVAQRHAVNCLTALTALRNTPEGADAATQRVTYKRMVDDVRAALRWCFSQDGDRALGVRLTSAAAPLFMRLSLLDEYRAHVLRVLSDSALVDLVDSSTTVSLHLALAHLLLHMGRTEAEMTSSFQQALELAERLGNQGQRAQAIAGAWLASTRCADYPRALELAERFRLNTAETAGERNTLIYHRMMALPLHYMGDFAASRQFIERALRLNSKQAQVRHDTMFYVDSEVVLYAILARNLFLLGFPDQAQDAATRSLERALAVGDAVGTCYSLVIGSCPVAFWRGDQAEAERLTNTLFEYATQYSLESWGSWAPYFEQLLGARSPGLARTPGSETIHERLDTMQTDALVTFSERAIPARAIERVESGRVAWNAAEMLRVAGEQKAKTAGPAKSVEALLIRSLNVARRQGALSWELRTAISLAQLWRAEQRGAEGRQLLAEVHARFTEGFNTEDYLRAAALMRELQAPH